MQGNSAAVRSNQPGLHPRLAEVVARHLSMPWRGPAHAATRPVLARLLALQAEDPRPLVLDSGCGTGESCLHLLERHPEARVVGIDRSALRLSARLGGAQMIASGRLLLARCEVADFWFQAAAAGLRLAAHYLLYPNPWPKAAQLRLRWHGHPALCALLELGGHLELRSNWRLYAEEFQQALAIAGHESQLETLPLDAPISPFERKYRASGHALYRLRAARLTGPRCARSSRS